MTLDDFDAPLEIDVREEDITRRNFEIMQRAILELREKFAELSQEVTP